MVVDCESLCSVSPALLAGASSPTFLGGHLPGAGDAGDAEDVEPFQPPLKRASVFTQHQEKGEVETEWQNI